MAIDIRPVVDLHEDISYYFVNRGRGLGFGFGDFSLDLERRHGDIPKYWKAGVSAVFAAIFPLPSTYSPRIASRLASGYGFSLHAAATRAALPLALEHFKTYYRLVKQHPKDLELLLQKQQIEEAAGPNKIFFLLSLEGCEALEDVEDVEVLYRLGLRALQPTWNYDTRYSASCMSKKDYGLTGEGEDLVTLCNEHGIIADMAHASKKAVLDACSVSKLPVIVSHANYSGVHNHKRNVDDQMIEVIKASGGVIGSTLISTTVSSKTKPTLEDLAQHIVEVYRRFGDDVLAIGTDFFGLIDTEPPEGLESIDKISNLWQKLLDMGLNEASIRKLAGENALRVIRQHADKWR